LKLTVQVRVEQVIENLHPGTKYPLSGWLKTTDKASPVILGVSGHGGPDATVVCADTGWERKTVDFVTDAGVTRVAVFLAQAAEPGEAFADNLGLPRNPREP
jgi:hypothetical protein